MNRERNVTEIATDVARTRLKHIAADREDRMIAYGKAWEQLWRNARAADAIVEANRRRFTVVHSS